MPEGLITITLNFFKRIHIFIGNPIDPTADNVVADFEHLASGKQYKEILDSINQDLIKECLLLEEQSNDLLGRNLSADH